MSRLSTSTIVIAPTIELVQQWRERLQKTFNIEVGQIGGGEKEALLPCRRLEIGVNNWMLNLET
jgi:superfamily II DNA or RNA helicase